MSNLSRLGSTGYVQPEGYFNDMGVWIPYDETNAPDKVIVETKIPWVPISIGAAVIAGALLLG